MEKAIVLLSSGLDSTAALLLLKMRSYEFSALTFDYGQRSKNHEIERAKSISVHFGIKHEVIELPWFKSFSSLLLSDEKLPSPRDFDLDNANWTKESAKAVWVPNRNGVMIEIGASIAEANGVSTVVTGFNAEEAETFPDNSLSYLEAINRSLFFSTACHVKVISPTTTMTKKEIFKVILDYEFPVSLLWSCYSEGTKMCGRCESCMRLKRAMLANDFKGGEYFEDSFIR